MELSSKPILPGSLVVVKDSNSICQPIPITSNNRFNILDDDESGKIDDNISGGDNVYKISYTYDGEVIGNVDDIGGILADQSRAAALDALDSSQYSIITRENMMKIFLKIYLGFHLIL